MERTTESPPRALLAEDDPAYANLIRAYLTADEPSYDVHHVEAVAEAVAAVEAEHFDVVLLDLNLLDSSGIDSLLAMTGPRATAPILVITGSRDETFAEAAIRAGAHDLAVKGDFDGVVLRRMIRHAIVRHQHYGAWLAEVSNVADLAELDHLASFHALRPARVASRALGLASLREAAPALAADLLGMYGDLLDRAVERASYKTATTNDADARSLARALGFAGATPRDVIELHTGALDERRRGVSAARAGAYVRESRLLLIEILGNLVSYYRARAVQLGSEPSLVDQEGVAP